MKKQTIAAIGIALILVVVGAYSYATAYKKPPQTPSSEGQQPTTTETPTENAKMVTYTMSDVAMHATREDCWFVINDDVYNVTDFIASGQHGGGDAILMGCGKDATEMFMNRPKDGTPHSSKAQNFAKTFIIGKISK